MSQVQLHQQHQDNLTPHSYLTTTIFHFFAHIVATYAQ